MGSQAQSPAGQLSKIFHSGISLRIYPIVILLIFGGAAKGTQLSYTESLNLTWGNVTFREGTQTFTEEAWFTRTPPTFGNNSVFNGEQQHCLSNSFLVCTGKVGSSLVWRIAAKPVKTDFPARATGGGCGFANFINFNSQPPDWESGSKSLKWTLAFTCETTAPPPAPNLELILLIDEVPPGTAWEIPIAQTLGNPQVQAYANLSPGAKDSLLANTNWVRLFLVAPPLHVPPYAIQSKPDVQGFEAPIGFGMRALTEIVAEGSSERLFTEDKYAAIRRRLSTESPDSLLRAYLWFPEPDLSQRQFPNTQIKTGMKREDLVLVANSANTGGPDLVERVLPDVGSSRVDLQACKLEYSIVSPK